MLTINSLLIVLIVVTIALLNFYFLRNDKQLKKTHHQCLNTLRSKIDEHSTQINFRKKNIDAYSFIEQKIMDALVVQPKIDIRI